MRRKKKLDEQTNILTPNEGDFSQRRRRPLPVDQPTIESFWQTPQTQTTSTATLTKTQNPDKAKQPIRHRGRLQHRMKNPPQYKSAMKQRSINNTFRVYRRQEESQRSNAARRERQRRRLAIPSGRRGKVVAIIEKE